MYSAGEFYPPGRHASADEALEEIRTSLDALKQVLIDEHPGRVDNDEVVHGEDQGDVVVDENIVDEAWVEVDRGPTIATAMSGSGDEGKLADETRETDVASSSVCMLVRSTSASPCERKEEPEESPDAESGDMLGKEGSKETAGCSLVLPEVRSILMFRI